MARTYFARKESTANAIASVPASKVPSIFGAKNGEWFVATSPSTLALPPKFQYVYGTLYFAPRVGKSSQALVNFIGTELAPK